MSTAISRAEDLSSLLGVQTWTALGEATLDSRLDALRDMALNLLREIELLKSARPSPSTEQPRLSEAVRHFETQLINAALEKTSGNQSRAARLLGVKHTTLNAKIKRYDISLNGYHHAAEVSNDEIAA